MPPDGVCPSFDECLDLWFNGSSWLRHDQSSRELPIRAPRTNEALPVRHGISDFLEASTAIYPVPPMALSGAARPPPTRRGLSSGQRHMKPWGNGTSPVLRE